MGTMAANPLSFPRYILNSQAFESGLDTSFGESGDRNKGLGDGRSVPDIIESELVGITSVGYANLHGSFAARGLAFVCSSENFRRHLLVGHEVVAVVVNVAGLGATRFDEGDMLDEHVYLASVLLHR